MLICAFDCVDVCIFTHIHVCSISVIILYIRRPLGVVRRVSSVVCLLAPPVVLPLGSGFDVLGGGRGGVVASSAVTQLSLDPIFLNIDKSGLYKSVKINKKSIKVIKNR